MKTPRFQANLVQCDDLFEADAVFLNDIKGYVVKEDDENVCFRRENGDFVASFADFEVAKKMGLVGYVIEIKDTEGYDGKRSGVL